MAADVSLPPGFEVDDQLPEGFEVDAPKEPSMAETVGDYALSGVPIVAGMVGAASPVPGGSLVGYAGGKAAERYLRQKFLGQKQPEQTLGQTAADLGEGALGNIAGGVIGKGVKYAAPVLKGAGGKIAEYAAGMFGSGAGQELLEKGIVKPALTAGRLAANAEGVKTAAGQEIGGILSQVKPRELTNRVIGKINQRIAEAEASGLKAPMVRRLQQIKDGILSTGKKTMTATEAEEAKRITGGLVNYERTARVPMTTQANKAAAEIFRDTTEGLVHRASKDLASKFGAAKKTFGLAAEAVEGIAGKSDGTLTGALKAAANPKGTLLRATPVTTTAASGLYGAGKIAGTKAAQNVAGQTARAATYGAIKGRFQPEQPDDAIEIPDERLNNPRFDGVLSRKERAVISNTPKAQELEQIDDEDMASELFLKQQTDPEFQELMKEGQE